MWNINLNNIFITVAAVPRKWKFEWNLENDFVVVSSRTKSIELLERNIFGGHFSHSRCLVDHYKLRSLLNKLLANNRDISRQWEKKLKLMLKYSRKPFKKNKPKLLTIERRYDSTKVCVYISPITMMCNKFQASRARTMDKDRNIKTMKEWKWTERKCFNAWTIIYSQTKRRLKASRFLLSLSKVLHLTFITI